jgi:ferredoxin
MSARTEEMVMKIQLDEKLCAVHGECVVEAPDYFDLEDDSDTAIVLQADAPEGARQTIERAASACPVAAIKIID